MLKNQLTGAHTFGISPDGKHFLYWKDNKFQAYDLDAGTSRTLGAGSPASFVDMEFDHPGPKPAYGIAGYTSDGKAVIAQQRYDLWLPLDGSAPKNLTNGVGTKNEIHSASSAPAPPGGRRPFAAPSGPAADDRPVEADHAVGLRRVDEEGRLLRAGERAAEGARLRGRLVQQSGEGGEGRTSSSSRARRSSSSPTCASPGPGFKDSKKITDANPQQAEYLWGHRILFDYKNKDGLRLQGILALPDDYKPGEKRPMLVNVLREELAEHAPLQRAVVPHRHGRLADAGGEPRATSRCCPTCTSTPARRTATCSSASRPRRGR